jgi:phage terminase small subunit
MRALSAMQRRFVVAKVMLGLGNGDACRAAGYAETVAGHTAHTIAHREDVQAAIEEEARKLMKSEGPKSVLTLVAIRDDKTAKAADRIKAST